MCIQWRRKKGTWIRRVAAVRHTACMHYLGQSTKPATPRRSTGVFSHPPLGSLEAACAPQVPLVARQQAGESCKHDQTLPNVRPQSLPTAPEMVSVQKEAVDCQRMAFRAGISHSPWLSQNQFQFPLLGSCISWHGIHCMDCLSLFRVLIPCLPPCLAQLVSWL